MTTDPADVPPSWPLPLPGAEQAVTAVASAAMTAAPCIRRVDIGTRAIAHHRDEGSPGRRSGPDR
ncbi:hypothetical protein [Streptomyces sp. DG1A-41]|uniref:hypothetical protein n=1 Tax=Streptomyces sp. DG1A-41 TaxID=3125779 RepID=UPI0030CED0BD